MPNTKSAKKRVKVTATKTLQNKVTNSALRAEIKKASPALEAQAGDKAEVVRITIEKIDQAAVKGALHKKTAVRRKFAPARKLNTTSAP